MAMTRRVRSTAPLTNLAPAIAFDADRRVIGSAPYPASWPALVDRFVNNQHRRQLADRLEAWIAASRSLIAIEQVCLGGSFCTDAPEPRDIDAVAFFRYHGPLAPPPQRDRFIQQHRGILTPDGIKAHYGIDCALVPLFIDPLHLVQLSAYWAMVYSNGPDGRRRAFYTVSAQSFPPAEGCMPASTQAQKTQPCPSA